MKISPGSFFFTKRLFFFFVFSSFLRASPTLYVERSISTLSYSGANLLPLPTLGNMYHLPATLSSFVEGRYMSFSFLSTSSDFAEKHFFLGYAWPLLDPLRNTFAIGVGGISTDGFTRYDPLGERLGEFSTSEYLIGVSHSLAISSKLRIGESLKFFYLDYDVDSTTSLALNLNLIYQATSFFYLHFSIYNFLSTPLALGDIEERIPMQFASGFYLQIFRKAYLGYRFTWTLPIYTPYSQVEHSAGVYLSLYKQYLQGGISFDGENPRFLLMSRVNKYLISVGIIPLSFETRLGVEFSFDFDAPGSGPFSPPLLRHSKIGEVEELLLMGLEKYNQRKYREAYHFFQKALEKDPENTLAKKYSRWALLHLKERDYLTEEEKRLIALHWKLAQEYEKEGKYGRAIEEYKAILEIKPTEEKAKEKIEEIRKLVRGKVESLYKEALAFYQKNEKLKAIDSLNDALKLDPDFKPAQEWLVKIQNELTEEELRERERIERLQKAEVFFTQGLNYYADSLYKEAIGAFQKALLLNPKHKKAKEYLELAKREWELQKKGKKGKEIAKKHYQKAKKHYDKGELYKAYQEVEYALSAYPKHAPSQKLLSLIQKAVEKRVSPLLVKAKRSYHKKAFSEAEKYLKEILNVFPVHQEAKELLATLEKEKASAISFNLEEGKRKYRRKKYSAAISHFQEVLYLDPNHKEAKKYLQLARKKVEKRVKALHKRALSFYEKGNLEKAISLWEKALRVDPSFLIAKEYIKEAKKKQREKTQKKLVKVWFQKGKSYFENREFDKAIEFFQKILEVNPNHTRAKDYLLRAQKEKEEEEKSSKIASLFLEGIQAFKKREYKKAIKKWKEVQKLDPENPLVARYIAKAQEMEKLRKVIDLIQGKKYLEEGKLLLAKEAFLRALKENPQSEEARKLLEETELRIKEESALLEKEGDIFFQKGEYIQAANMYRKAYRLTPTERLATKRKEALLAQKYLEEGLKHFRSEKNVGRSIEPFRRVLSLNPYDKRVSKYIQKAKEKAKKQFEYLLQLAKSFLKRKEYKEAYSLYTSLSQIAPQNKEVLKGMATSLKELRKKAQKLLEEAQEAIALRNYILAEEKLEEALEILPEEKRIQALLKEVRAKKIAQQKRSLAKRKTASQKENQLIQQGILLYRQGKYREAIQVWRKIPKSSPLYSKAQKYIARAKLKL